MKFFRTLFVGLASIAIASASVAVAAAAAMPSDWTAPMVEMTASTLVDHLVFRVVVSLAVLAVAIGALPIAERLFQQARRMARSLTKPRLPWLPAMRPALTPD